MMMPDIGPVLYGKYGIQSKVPVKVPRVGLSLSFTSHALLFLVGATRYWNDSS